MKKIIVFSIMFLLSLFCFSEVGAGETPITWLNVQITTAPGASTYPSMAWNGNGYGIVWSDARDGGEDEVYFAQTDNSGNKIIQDIQLSNSDVMSYYPQIVWTGKEYGALWANFSRYDVENYANGCRLQFVRMDENGNKQGNILDVASDNFGICPSNPILVWNGSGYGVFWQENKQNTGTSRIFYAKLDSIGNKIGSDIQLTDSYSGMESNLPTVAWDGSAYAIIWRHGPFFPPSETYLTRYDINGTKIGSDIFIAPSVTAAQLVGWGLIWDGSAYGVLFRGIDSSRFRQQYYMRIDSSGSILVGGVQITNNAAANGELWPGYAVWGNNALAIIYNTPGSPSHLYFSEVNIDGSIKTAPVKIDNTTVQAMVPHIVWNGSDYAAVWNDSRHGNAEIYFASSILSPKDVIPPVITLLGKNPVNLYVGNSYTDAGATAVDDVDGSITAKIVVVNPVNINVVGAYIITYNVSDAAGNPAKEVSRTVNVLKIPDIPPSITVTHPNGGETFRDGSAMNIQWRFAGVDKVDIWWQTYGPLGNIANSNSIVRGISPASGSYLWTIPASFSVEKPNTVRMKIMILATTDGIIGAIRDLSDNYFSIVAPPPTPFITVLYPNGGETFRDGSAMNIQWRFASVDKIYIYWQTFGPLGNALNSIAIASGISPASGSYLWTIPAHFSVIRPNAVRMKIMISSTVGTGAIRDLSDNYFSIVP